MAYQSKYTGLQIDDILDSVEWKQGKIEDLASIRAGAAKGATALQSYTEKYTGTVTGIKINGVVKSGSGVIDLGTISTPTKTSQLENDNNFITPEDVAAVALSGSYNDLHDTPTIPSAVTESTVSGWGFTKNTGTYSKPSGGIPKNDLASAVQTSLGKADTAIQSTSFGELTDLAVVKGFESAQNGTVYALPDCDTGDEDDILLSRSSVKTVNGQSIVGSGDIEIGGGSSSGSGAYSEVNHGTSDTTFTLTPNTFHVWDEVASLTLDLGSETSGVANEYLFQFTSGATATTLSLPSDLKWANDSAPTIEPNMIYQVSILKGLASVLEFSNPQLILISFTIDSIQYQAEEGMSWSIWCNSQYNTDFVIDGDCIWKGNTIRYYIGVNGMPETPSSIIIDGTSYELIDDW